MSDDISDMLPPDGDDPHRVAIDYESVTGVLVEALAAGLYRSMTAKGANNYIAFQMYNDERERFLALFVRLPDGKTPMELAAEAKAEAVRLADKVQKLRKTAGFFASCVRSGEKWTETCDEMYRELLDI